MIFSLTEANTYESYEYQDLHSGGAFSTILLESEPKKSSTKPGRLEGAKSKPNCLSRRASFRKHDGARTGLHRRNRPPSHRGRAGRRVQAGQHRPGPPQELSNVRRRRIQTGTEVSCSTYEWGCLEGRGVLMRTWRTFKHRGERFLCTPTDRRYPRKICVLVMVAIYLDLAEVSIARHCMHAS